MSLFDSTVRTSIAVKAKMEKTVPSEDRVMDVVSGYWRRDSVPVFKSHRDMVP